MPAISPISLSGFLDLPDIAGGSRHANHKNQIEIHRVGWSVAQETAAARGRGRVRSRTQIAPLVVGKWYDAASPYLALAAMEGRSFESAVLSFHHEASGKHMDYLTITLGNVLIAHYDVLDEYNELDEPVRSIPERIGLDFETIRIRYVEQNRRGGAGDEHEIAFDIAAGARA